MSPNIDHDRFVAQNKSLSAAFERESTDKKLEKKGFSHIERQREASCFNCKSKSKCATFKMRQTGGTKGVVSYGGDEKFICEKYVPAPAENKGMSDKQIKSLLKTAMRKY